MLLNIESRCISAAALPICAPASQQFGLERPAAIAADPYRESL
jgi:hypothetical protein